MFEQTAKRVVKQHTFKTSGELGEFTGCLRGVDVTQCPAASLALRRLRPNDLILSGRGLI